MAALLMHIPAHAANISSPAVPVSTILTVQPIVVCQGSGTVSSAAGTGCAPSNGLGAYETYTNTILDQAGIGVAFAAPEYLDNSSYLTVQSDTTATSVFDTAHNLLRLPGNGQSTNPDTLNVYLVDNIISTTNGIANGTGVYGLGLIGGNGAIIATAPNMLGRQAAVDTMAHELSHNLGLNHVDAAPYAGTAVDTLYNLMNSGSRVVPFETCQVAPYSCAPPKGDTLAPLNTTAASTSGTTTLTLASTTGVLPGMVATGTGIPANDIVSSVTSNTVTLAAALSGNVAASASIRFASPPETDQLLGPNSPANQPTVIDNQIGTLQAPPIFTQLPKVLAAPGIYTGVDYPEIYPEPEVISFGPPAATPVATWKFRFLPPATDSQGVSGVGITGNPSATGTATTRSVGTHFEVDVSSNVPLTYPDSLMITTFWSASVRSSAGAYSSEYDFTNGITSRAGFDRTGNSSSSDGAIFTFDPNTPGLATGPSYLPTELGAISPITGQPVTMDTETSWSTPDVVAATQLPFEALDGPVNAPEPASLLLLGTAIGGLIGMRRRSAV